MTLEDLFTFYKDTFEKKEKKEESKSQSKPTGGFSSLMRRSYQ
jgi:hypothetical protein